LCACSPVGIFLTDTEGRCTYTNPRCQSIFGFTLEESLGNGWAQFVHPEDRAPVFQDWFDYIHGGHEYSRELRFQDSQGLIRFVQVRSAPMVSATGQLLGHVGTVEDVTESKQAVLALRESESKYRMLMEQASDGIHTYDLEGNFIETNSKLCEMLGYTREELLRLNVRDLIPLEEIASAPLRLAELRAGETIISERQLRRKDGTVLPVEISGKMLPNGALQAIIRDITKRKRAEEAIRFQTHLLDTVEQAVIATDLSGTVIYWNRFAEQLYGWPATEVIGHNIIDTLASQATQDRASEIMSHLTAGESWSGEFIVRRRDGTTFPAMITDTPIYNDGSVMVGIVGLSVDITERKRAEAALGESERFARSTIDALPQHIAVLDEKGTIIATNKAWNDFAGSNHALMHTVAEGANYLAVCERAAGANSEEAAAFAAGIRDIINNEREEFSLEYPCHSSSESRWFNGRVTRFQSEGPTRIVVSHENITARKRAEEELKRNEEWLRAIFAASRDGILVEDNEQIVYVNKSYARLFGYDDPAELVGRHVSDLISPEDEARLLDFGRQRTRGDLTTSSYEFKGRRKDGTPVDVEASVAIATFAGHVYITTMIRDIAERKQAEEALRDAHHKLERRVAERTAELANINQALQSEIRERTRTEEARQQLLGQLVTAQEDERRRISRELHDQMGQHLTGIMLLVQSMRDSCQWETSLKMRFQQLEEVAHQLAQEADTLAWELRPTALDDLGLQVALGHYVEKWSERSQLPVEFHSAGLSEQRLPPQIETAIYRVVQESLTNIAKHARASCVSLILERRGDDVSTIIEDDGCGFDVEATLGAPARERRMGLLGMQERVALVGGALNLESTRGVGTTIFIRIPAALNGNGESNLE
jgi:PAS domain S-box-containing protein